MISINFLLFTKVHLLDLAGPVQAFYEANTFSPGKYKIRYLAASTKVRSQQGLSLTDLELLDQVEVKEGDIICIPGIDFHSFKTGSMDKEIALVKDWVLDHYKNRAIIMSICSGALILAKIGLLNNKECTTHWKCFEYMRNEFPNVRIKKENLYCHDQNIYTSAGMTAGIDMALSVIEKYSNSVIAAKVAQEMVINIRREDIHDQKNLFLDFNNKYHPVVYRVQNIIQNRMNENVTVESLAEELNMSERNLNRLFKKYINKSITAYRHEVKISEAENMLRNSVMNLKEISNALGYATPQYFMRVWKKKHRVTPMEYRKNN